MRLLDTRVRWKEGIANDPRLEILVDEIPPLESMRFEHHEDGIWFAEKDGFVRYFSWTGPENEGGFSGGHFDIKTVDGEEVTLKGPWSSRAGVVNKRGFGPVVDVSITTRPEGFNEGRALRSGSITLRKAKQAVDLIGDGVHLEQRLKFDNDEPVWIPVGRPQSAVGYGNDESEIAQRGDD